jgi:hypothetical protein
MVTVNDPAVMPVGISITDKPLSPVMCTLETHCHSLTKLVKTAPVRVSGVSVPAFTTSTSEALIEGAAGPEPLAKGMPEGSYDVSAAECMPIVFNLLIDEGADPASLA